MVIKNNFSFIIAFIFLTVCINNLWAQKSDYSKIKGSWQGAIAIEKDSFNIVFDIYPDSANSVYVSFPDVAMIDTKPQRSKFSNDSLILVLPKMGAIVKLVYTNPTSLSGYWYSSASNDSSLLVLNKTNTPLRVLRPQTPKPPFPYLSETVQIKNTKANVNIEGTLTLPSGKGPFPAVILVSGSGPQERNSEILMHKSFWVIADYFTRRGIAVFRYDERGVGKSTGTYTTATTIDFADDLEEIYKVIRKDKRLNPTKIGLMGHSEGGIIIAIAASKLKSVGFLVSLAGSAVSGYEILMEQAKQMNIAAGKDSSFINYDYQFRKQIFEIFLNTPDKKEFSEKIKKLFESAIAELGEDKAKEYNITKSNADLWIMQLSSPWMETFIRLDPAIYWSQITCPIMVLIGEKDLQVPYSQNMPRYKEVFEKSKNKNVTLLKMESLNHLFQTCKTGSVGEYARIQETFSPNALKLISDFILNQNTIKK